jgi:hypothetical protein
MGDVCNAKAYRCRRIEQRRLVCGASGAARELGSTSRHRTITTRKRLRHKAGELSPADIPSTSIQTVRAPGSSLFIAATPRLTCTSIVTSHPICPVFPLHRASTSSRCATSNGPRSTSLHTSTALLWAAQGQSWW